MYVYSGSNGEVYPYVDSSDPLDSLAWLYPEYIPAIPVFRCISTGDQPTITVEKNNDGTPKSKTFGKDSPNWSSYGYDNRTGFRNVDPMMPVAADMDGSSVVNPQSATANHQGGQNVLFYDTHVAWKSVNTWGNPHIGEDESDNFFEDDHGGGDTDCYISR